MASDEGFVPPLVKVWPKTAWSRFADGLREQIGGGGERKSKLTGGLGKEPEVDALLFPDELTNREPIFWKEIG